MPVEGPQQHLEMGAAHDSLIKDFEGPLEQRLGKPLAPRAELAKLHGQGKVDVPGIQFAVGQQLRLQAVAIEVGIHAILQGLTEGIEAA